MLTSKNTVAIKDLPIYPEPAKLDNYHFIEDGPVLGQDLTCGIRANVQDYWKRKSAEIRDMFGIANRKLEPVKGAATATEDYIRREEDLLPKAAAITVGGMLGFVMAMRRGGMMRRMFYSLGGILTMTAFCYPHETVQVVRTGIAHSQMAWENFKQSPEPKNN